jgi:hypothetical protein
MSRLWARCLREGDSQAPAQFLGEQKCRLGRPWYCKILWLQKVSAGGLMFTMVLALSTIEGSSGLSQAEKCKIGRRIDSETECCQTFDAVLAKSIAESIVNKYSIAFNVRTSSPISSTILMLSYPSVNGALVARRLRNIWRSVLQMPYVVRRTILSRDCFILGRLMSFTDPENGLPPIQPPSF